jgi:hypothetical protein
MKGNGHSHDVKSHVHNFSQHTLMLLPAKLAACHPSFLTTLASQVSNIPISAFYYIFIVSTALGLSK